MKLWIALLRGINVGGHNKIPMVDLRELCGELGWRNVATYIQSGNVVFSSDKEVEALEDDLQAGIRERFGLEIHTLVRSATEWPAYIAANPFPKASETQPNLVMLALSKAPLPDEAAGALQKSATAGERVIEKQGALWIHFPEGSARSRLTPALLDRLTGSPVTTRNWRTVVKLAAMLEERAR